VAKVGTSNAGGTISQQAAVHQWLAADANGNKPKHHVLAYILQQHFLQSSATISCIDTGFTSVLQSFQFNFAPQIV
jgi:hypothetical protein